MQNLFHTLTDAQKLMCVYLSKEVITAAKNNPNFLKFTVMGDETWCFHQIRMIQKLSVKVRNGSRQIHHKPKNTEGSIKNQGNGHYIF